MGMYNNTYSPAVTSNRSLNHMDVQIAQQQAQSMMTDEFPHLDIINDLLEDEQCSNMVYNGSIFNPQPQVFNGQYSSYHGELLSGGRTRSFGEEGLHYMARGPYGTDGMMPRQWQMTNMDLSLPAMRSNGMEDGTSSAANYHHSYFGLDASNPSFTSGINGYTEFRPSNGH